MILGVFWRKENFRAEITYGYSRFPNRPSNFLLYEKGIVATPDEIEPIVACILEPIKTSMLAI